MKGIRNIFQSIKTRWKLWLKISTGFLLLVLVIPTPSFTDPTSTVVFSSEGELLGARIATDGQWRFPATKAVPENYAKALLTFEDQWFYYHPGVNPVSLFRALVLNIKNKRIVSGGSTITMQVARLSRKNPPRNIPGKLLEMCMAIKLECLKSKAEILSMYASGAPFGGNVVGIDAAAWRYFNRPADHLSWAEAATLAVLPNSPSLIYPGKNSPILKEKRDKLLEKLCLQGSIDSLTLMVSVAEPLPLKPLPLPDLANHVVEKMASEFQGKNVSTTIQYNLQKNVNQVVERHHQQLMQNEIYNIAALVIEVETGNTLAYIGNTKDTNGNHGGHVDVVTAPRSTGSILKPFLYASMLQYGEMLPHSLVSDVPINFSGYAPKNFDYSYSGAVPASQALSRSLNVPAVEMLHQFGEARFLDGLRNIGFTSFSYPSEHYGLTLILGGGETKLLELGGAYASMARILKHFHSLGGYSNSDIALPTLISKNRLQDVRKGQAIISASSVWFTFKALQEVNRPEDRSGWFNFSSSRKVAWKTGTSFGFRDAWAVGTNPSYVVAVWVGNANGEGRPGLTGSKAAAPVLFDILDLLPKVEWFTEPDAEITTIEVCAESGFRASPVCPHVIQEKVPVSGLRTGACSFHHLVNLSEDRLWRVNASCYPIGKMVHDSSFVLPPAIEWFYRKIHPEYSVLPPMMHGCVDSDNYKMIELLYPRNTARIFVPHELDGSLGKVVFEAAHRNMNTRLFWYIDDEFLGETDQFHQMALAPSTGAHVLTIIDKDGNTLKKHFEIVSRE